MKQTENKKDVLYNALHFFFTANMDHISLLEATSTRYFTKETY